MARASTGAALVGADQRESPCKGVTPVASPAEDHRSNRKEHDESSSEHFASYSPRTAHSILQRNVTDCPDSNSTIRTATNNDLFASSMRTR